MTTLMIVFITLKIINFADKDIFDYILLVLLAVYMVLDIIGIIKNWRKNGRK